MILFTTEDWMEERKNIIKISLYMKGFLFATTKFRAEVLARNKLQHFHGYSYPQYELEELREMIDES